MDIPYGRRVVPAFIDQLSREAPGKVCASIPRSTNLSEGYLDVTYDDFSRAINRGAAFLGETFGRSQSFETLAYLGVFDLRYFILACAACKVGYKLLLPSPRNSLEGQVNLFNLTECKALLISEGYEVPPQLISDSGLSPISVPSLATLLAKGDVPHYPFTRSYDEAKNDPFVVLHTSGSTGLPKPIILKHGWTGSFDAFNLLGKVDHYECLWWSFKNKKTFVGLPPFHAAGLINALLAPLWYDKIVVWPPASRPMSAVLAEEILDHSGADMIYVAPSILEEMAQSSASLARLERLAAVGYGGAPLDTETGELLSKKTHVVNTTGSTELGPLPFFAKAPEDWAYFHFDPALKGIEFHPVGDGAYEQIFVRHPSTDKYHSAWWTFPDLNEYSMNDLYTPHPDPAKSNLWLYAGRADDVIVLSNGEKLNPANMEVTLRQHPSVKGALVVGQSRFVPAAIVELRDEIAKTPMSPAEKAKFLEDEIWQFAVKANEAASAHSQLSPDRIILSDPEKPFARAAKGTMQRGATIKLYADEIEEIYARIEESVDVSDLPKIDVHQDLESLKVEIGKMVEGVMKVEGLRLDQDFFATGMDSLHVMTLVRMLKSALVGIWHGEINSRLVYSNSTVAMLASALKGLDNENGIANGAQSNTREERMLKILADFTSQLPKQAASRNERSSNQHVVLLTGSTGSLGSYLLHNLLSSSKVSKVCCLNRTRDAEARQAKGNLEKGLISAWDHRVKFLHADLSKPFLNLDERNYAKLKDSVTTIIHNQWPVSFNLSLPSFTPHIQGVLNLITLSSQSPLSPPINFISSIGTLANYPSNLVPEMPFKDPSFPLNQGYSESKWISENLLLASNIKSSIMRIGQIAGPVDMGRKGEWNRNEWFPTLVKNSGAIGAVPDELPGQGEVRWMPVDVVAEVITELVVGGGKGVFHIANPREGRWGDLVGFVKERFQIKEKSSVDVVKFGEWVERLERSAEEKNVDVERNPGVKLLDFYRGMMGAGREVVMDTRETEERSERMRSLEAVSGEWMRLWLEQWSF